MNFKNVWRLGLRVKLKMIYCLIGSQEARKLGGQEV
jgi:hypothetical protein